MKYIKDAAKDSEIQQNIAKFYVKTCSEIQQNMQCNTAKHVVKYDKNAVNQIKMKKWHQIGIKKKGVFDLDRTRTCNPQIRSLMPYPLGHKAALETFRF